MSRRSYQSVRNASLSGLSDEFISEFRKTFREQVRNLLSQVMQAEVDLLCGPKHQQNSSSIDFRAGSAPGYVLHEGRRLDVIRPRVRRKTASGKSSEAILSTYAEAQYPGELRERISEAFSVGVSGREQSRLHGEGTPGTSKSEVSRLWQREGAKILQTFRSRDIIRPDWLVLQLDGIRLDRDLTAIVALGLAEDGTKLLLDFELGASENSESAKGLVERLERRGFSPAAGCRLLAVLDGSQALRNGVLAYWPDAVIQRCLVHKERNIQRFLPKRHWGESARLFDRLRKAEGLKAGQEALGELERFLSRHNAAALESLKEAGDELLAVHRLEIPATLHTSLLSTNLIENPFRNVRRKTGRVCRWRKDTEQASRWLAYALLEAERGFRRIRDYRSLVLLRKVLERPTGGG